MFYILFSLVWVNLNSLRDGTDNLTSLGGHFVLSGTYRLERNSCETLNLLLVVIRLGLTYESDLIIRSILIVDIKYAAYAISHA